MPEVLTLGSSFRDPSGFVFKTSKGLYRQINQVYKESFELLEGSGLLSELWAQKLLVSHERVTETFIEPDRGYAVIQPAEVPFISYPYEWCFSQLKDAALATLKIQKLAIGKGMSLKDASAYNIQFLDGHPILIDTLSFEPYVEGKPWIAYRQFCQHFLAPLVLMSHVDVRLGRLSATFIDGVPLDLASTLSKPHTKWNPKIAMHLHIHAQMQAKAANSGTKAEVSSKFNKNAILGLVDNLESLVQGLKWTPDGTEWANYYEDTNYSSESMDSKHKLVVEFLESIAPRPQMVWDLGANNGEFSSLASKRGMMTVAWDIDPAAVEKNYITRKSDPKMMPLVQDLTNPSPSIGWSNAERDSLAQRGPVDAVMALALIHHLAIGNNVPLEMIADFLAKVSQNLIIEFVPKEDSQVQRLLASREDIFSRYDIENFRKAFGRLFDLTIEREIPGSKRTLFMMRKKAA